MKILAWLIKDKNGKVFSLTKEILPGWALAHYVVAQHHKIPLNEVTDTGWEFLDGTVEWRSDFFRPITQNR